ncbi:hypothetical protein [Rhodococcus sp. NPDC058521]|uniref:hypothetical protein n=1 Tax=Rhodococcus sp. NPDC058521 TaxID=3346536 RepID=UPI0036565E7B
MKFTDTIVSKQGRYSVGIEEESGRHYVSIPVSNGIVDYEEYNKIGRDSYDLFRSNRLFPFQSALIRS